MISIKLIVDRLIAKTTFFIINVATTYNALLGRDYILVDAYCKDFKAFKKGDLS